MLAPGLDGTGALRDERGCLQINQGGNNQREKEPDEVPLYIFEGPEVPPDHRGREQYEQDPDCVWPVPPFRHEANGNAAQESYCPDQEQR